MEIRPFRGWRYRPGGGDVSSFICPPYDVLTQADKDALLRRDPGNIVAVDLPHCPPAEIGPDAAYRQAADTLRHLQQANLLIREDAPSLYAYQQRYTWAGHEHIRRGLIAAVRLEQFGKGVWPHEKTFPGPKADRLKLTQATGMQMSPIFGFYEGGRGVVEAFFGTAGEAAATAALAGVQEKLWVASDDETIARVTGALAQADLFIADGHHRYTTALNYRDSIGPIARDHPANYIMFVLVAMNDPGLMILPTHRVIADLEGFDLGGFAAAAGEVMSFESADLADQDVAAAGAFLARLGSHAMAFVSGEKALVGRLKDPAVMDRLAPDRTADWRRLDVAILHRLLLDEYLAANMTDRTRIEYTADGPAALAAARSGQADLAVFLQAAGVDEVRRIALAGETMPHKSTYFYPKLATGMVLYPLT